MTKVARQPSLYIPHGGGPCFFMDKATVSLWQNMQGFLESLAGMLPEKPKALLVISAHWEESEPTLNTTLPTSLLYDYYGFPEHTYQLTYPVAGDKQLMDNIVSLLAKADIPLSVNSERGLDHGVFIPLKLIYPDADIPTVQFSLVKGLDPSTHLQLGEALAPLRDQGVLIIGSGMSYHNLRAFGGGAGEAASKGFDDWLTMTLENSDVEARNQALCVWEQAPYAREAHPREEHLLPLMVAAGAALDDEGQRIYSGKVDGLTFSAFQFG